MKKITKEQFEREYAEGSEMTVDELRKLGGRVLPCDCEYKKCEGWQVQFPNRIPTVNK